MAKKDGAPDRIYLQFGPDCIPDDIADSEWESGEVTWCSDRVYDTDIEYVNAAAIARLTAERDKWHDRYFREVHGQNNEGDLIGGVPSGLLHEVSRLTAEKEAAVRERDELREQMPKDALGNPIVFSVYWFWQASLGLCSVRIENIGFDHDGFSVYGTASQCSPCPETYDATFDDTEDLYPTIADAKSARESALAARPSSEEGGG